MARTRRAGSAEYGLLANRYVFGFEEKWIRGDAPDASDLLGTGDIQSLADLGNSFEIVRGLKLVPFTNQTVIQLAVMTLLPVAPLLLTMVSLEELLKRLLKILL